MEGALCYPSNDQREEREGRSYPGNDMQALIASLHQLEERELAGGQRRWELLPAGHVITLLPTLLISLSLSLPQRDFLLISVLLTHLTASGGFGLMKVIEYQN